LSLMAFICLKKIISKKEGVEGNEQKSYYSFSIIN
jgi:hypothetical protein